MGIRMAGMLTITSRVEIQRKSFLPKTVYHIFVADLTDDFGFFRLAPDTRHEAKSVKKRVQVSIPGQKN